jgi:type II secretory pathway pseudopilin PulG
MLLSTLIERIGVAVQEANRVVEQSAAEAFLQSTGDAEATEGTSPATVRLALPLNGENKSISVPKAVLTHNTTMRLDSLDINLKFALEADSEEIRVRVLPGETREDTTASELSLHFSNAPAPEGVARTVQRHLDRF